uniref:Centrosomal protein 192 n=1 Tax=Sphaeramia orbicularis TaxID=375764 RepID=A0A672Y5X5_9TELE
MADSFYKLEDEVFPSFLSKSLDSTMGRATLGNVTLGSGPGLPVAASTVAKNRPGSDNRWERAAGLGRCGLLTSFCVIEMQIHVPLSGANATHSVVYQDEEGQWVTDLAYYSSFEKEVDGKTSENAIQFQAEDFFCCSQEEQIPPAGGNGTFQSDSSWKVPNSGHILMRTSQVSSAFKEDDQSYLRLSFGQFFGQRSEALGCLGESEDADGVKRPSFGYIINSPEKREPFALIHPSDFSDTSPHNDTVELCDADKTLNTGVFAILPSSGYLNEGSGSESNRGNESCMSPHNNSSHLMLSISTIASAIADASISTDPSQLAAMIMELSKRSKTLMEDQNTVLDELHRSTCVGEVSAFDMDKYLKKTDVSSSSDASVVHTTFDLTGWTDNPCTPYRNPQKDCPTEKGSTAQPVGSESAHMVKTSKPQETDGKAETTLNTTSSSQTFSTGLYPVNANESKRSSIPRPHGSCSSVRRSVGSGQSSTLEPHPDKTAACDNDSSSATKSGTANHQASQSNIKSSLETPQNSDRSPVPSPDLLRTTSGRRKGPTGLPCVKGSSPSAVRNKSTGREQHDGSSSSSGVKVTSGTASASHTRSSVDKHVGFCCQVVVPEELRFPHACCVGIASQTSLSLFNPSERWQQVSITITSLAIDGEKVDSSPYHWLIVKNKTIIGPKSTEDQKVLFIPPQAGVYQCVLSVCSWPASAESEVAARASIFAKRVVLVAIAENPTVEVEMGKTGCLDFGDLPSGSAKSLSLKLLNRTHATVPIRLVLSANASAWRCFTLSKLPVTMTSEATQQAGHMTPMSSPSVMNHVMHASYGENPESFMVWVHFKAPSKYTASSGELGPADEYLARVDVEVDSPGPTHVIMSIPLRARSGSARVHAPKDLQTVSLSAPLGKSSQQTLPLKNAGNIDVQLKLKTNEIPSFPIYITFTLSLYYSLLTILVLPSGPQYEVNLKGQVASENSGKPAIPSTSAFGPALANDIPPILSNKQFVAWGGVTLGRAIQQKLVLRNNSNTATQQLRLLIRGQDQDCFQLQSMFSPEERLTRHGELSIRPREDVTVHMLFAPTRVACMLAKLEIKQSGVRPSQPGVKFTIPLSGYGGTSNIILEDQRKQADGYVATLADIAVGRVSKVCLCVRNTGSRAAFIKAVAFSDVQSRTVMEQSVISLAPSQFVLKERTQEVGEQTAVFIPSPSSCSRLLQNKPEAARKALSENSLLKNVDFNEKFLGEETVTEPYDLPQRPSEAHIFYGNMSKVVVSLLGSTKAGECEQSNHTEMLLPSTQRGSDTDSGLANGNVSLDVLPVKGPQGPVLKVAEPSLKVLFQWILIKNYPHVALNADGATTTSKVQIQNNTSRELSFDLSWPAHCLTITPQHGVIECHLQILISPNPSLANKSALLPWSGQIYVQCDGQQKFIKVQIRGDLALDVSAAPGDACLAALAPQAATPVAPVAQLIAATKPLLPLQMSQAQVTVSNKTIIFPTTPSGETSEAQLEVENGDVEMRWYLSSFAPPYVKGVDNTEDVYRATYTAFRCSRVSGTLGGHEKMQVPITFLPRDRGDYAQFWDLECHPVSEPQQKTRIRFQLCGTGIRSGPMEGPQEGDCSLVKTEATVKSRKKEEAGRRGVYAPQDLYTFPATRVGESSSLKVNIRNNSPDTHELKFVNPREPFHIKHSKYSLRSQHYLKLPVHFKPSAAGSHAGLLLIQSETSGNLVIQLTGEASP